MSVALPGDDAAAMERFFQAFEQRSEESAAGLGAFFQQFDSAYAHARDARSATTPHLDVLGVFGLERAELRHSAALAWFLEAEGKHEQGALFANAFLRLLGGPNQISEPYQVGCERLGRTDVFLYARGQVAVFVENKVLALEQDNQMTRMVERLVWHSADHAVPIENRYAVFLTDNGSAPKTGLKEDLPGFLATNQKLLTRVEVFSAFREALTAQPRFSPLLLNLLDSYLGGIRRFRHRHQ